MGFRISKILMNNKRIKAAWFCMQNVTEADLPSNIVIRDTH